MDEAWVAIFGLFIVGFLAFAGLRWWWSPLQVAKRKLRATPVAPISGLRPGQRVKITGRVVLADRLTSPLLKRTCAYWNVQIEEKVGKNSWAKRVDEWEGVPFWVEDGSGRAWVDPGQLKLTVESEHAGGSGVFDSATPTEAAVLERFGMTATGMLGLNRTLRFQEASVHDGEQVSVYGEVALREVAGEPALTLVAPADEPLVVSDAAGVGA